MACDECGESWWFPNDSRRITITHQKGRKGTLLPWDIHIVQREESQ